jgi:hypothetical protein
VFQWLSGFQNAVKSRFGRQINALIRQSRHDLTGRQIGKFTRIGDAQNLCAFGLGQGMRRRVLPQRTQVFRRRFTGLPALQGARTQARHGTGLLLAGTGGRRLGYGGHQILALLKGDHATSPPSSA